MNRYEKVQTLCKQRGISIRRLETELKLSNGYISKMKDSKPNADAVLRIAKFFQVPVEALEDDANLSRNERFIYNDYFKEKPLYRASAGTGAYNSAYPDETISVDDADSGYQYVKVVGNSMSPILEDGDIAVVELTSEVNPHDLTVIRINGDEAIIKYIEVVNDGLWIKAENKSVYEDRFYTVADVLSLPIFVIGKVIELRRKIK